MIHFFNTFGRIIEDFHPIKEGKIGLYTCGPTVYDYAHIGNFRTFLWEDLLKRFLKWEGYDIVHVMNITDVDDKTITGANREGISLAEYTKKYEDAFFEDMKTLNVFPATFYPRATEHVNEMIKIIEDLNKKGHTYESEGSIYFRVKSFPNYGALSGTNIDSNIDGARVDSDEYEKEEAKDFALWKASREGEPYWESPFGRGRPGWHIECSAMSRRYLGKIFDIHCGGVDNIFPHHENEIAQSECSSGERPAKYWLHAEHLMVDGEKMSKSKGNFFTFRNLLEKGIDPLDIRYLLLSVHYRKPLNFTFEGISSAKLAKRRIIDTFKRLSESRTCENNASNKIVDMSIKFKDALENDLNTSMALGILFDAIKEVNTLMDEGRISNLVKSSAIKLMNTFSEIFGIPLLQDVTIDDAVLFLIQEREKARKLKDYKRADEIRKQIDSMGIIIEDTPMGTSWKRK